MGFATIATMVGGAVVSKALNRKNDKAARDAANAQTNLANLQGQMAQEQYDDWKNDFLPLQGDIAREARNAGSQQELDTAAERANADVTQAFGRGKSDLSSRLMSMGVDPSHGRFATTFGRYGLAEAAAQAGAGLASAAAMHGNIAANAQNAASRNSAGIGSLFQTAMPAIQKWWNTPSPMPGGGMSNYDPTVGG